MSDKEKVVVITNREFMKSEIFTRACDNAKIPPTIRQAGKFRRGVGAAYKARKAGSNDQA